MLIGSLLSSLPHPEGAFGAFIMQDQETQDRGAESGVGSSCGWEFLFCGWETAYLLYRI